MWYTLIANIAIAGSLTIAIALLWHRSDSRGQQRLAELNGKQVVPSEQEYIDNLTRVVRTTLPKMGESLVPDNEKDRLQLASRMIQAGLYSPRAMPVFLGVKLVMMLGPMVVALVVAATGAVPLHIALLGGVLLGVVGMVGPSFWLDRRKSQRQTALRRALPDACDLIVICMSGGLSLIGALTRVVEEMRTAHPLLATELRIVEREVQLGDPIAGCLQQFGTRSDLPELQNLAAVVMAAEKYGSSMARTLEKFSELLRLKRQQYAEQMAQKAATKVLFPTLLFIFPVILLIILGPAMIQVFSLLKNLSR